MTDPRELLRLLSSRDPKAADEVELLGRQLLDLAQRLRSQRYGNQDPGGMGDRVKIEVIRGGE